MKEIAAAMLAAWMSGSEPARDWFETYEETCAGWDGAAALAEAEDAGICRYFELDAACRQGRFDCPWAN